MLLCTFLSISTLANAVVPPYGQLSVKGNKLVGSNGQEVALHGMSLFWSQWSEGSVFYNKDTVQALKCSWNANVVRAAMGVEEGGYLTNPGVEQSKVDVVVQAAIDLGIYVIIDWHDHNAHTHTDKGIAFFTAMSKRYAGVPNVLYEVYNEPLQVSWTDAIKPYHQAVVNAIRTNDKNNIIILGTPTWSQDVDVAAQNPVSGTNLMYTLHYYAASHKQSLRDKATAALNKGIAIFVTEYGTVDASGGGSVDTQSSNEWWTYLDQNKISYVNWGVYNKAEAAAALIPGTTAQQVGDDSKLTASGKLVKNKLKSQNNGINCSGTNNPVVTTRTPNVPVTTQAPNNGGSSSGLSVSMVLVQSWTGGGQYKLVFKNIVSTGVCGADFNVVFSSGVKMENNWNFSLVSGTKYTLPSWVNIQPGKTFEDAGLSLSGYSLPNLSIVSIKKC